MTESVGGASVIIRFTNEEQMQTYNDIEQLNSYWQKWPPIGNVKGSVRIESEIKTSILE